MFSSHRSSVTFLKTLPTTCVVQLPTRDSCSSFPFFLPNPTPSFKPICMSPPPWNILIDNACASSIITQYLLKCLHFWKMNTRSNEWRRSVWDHRAGAAWPHETDCASCSCSTEAFLTNHVETITVEEGHTLTLNCSTSLKQPAPIQWLAPSGFTIFLDDHSGKWRKEKQNHHPTSRPGIFQSPRLAGGNSAWVTRRVGAAHLLRHVNGICEACDFTFGSFGVRKSEMETPPAGGERGLKWQGAFPCPHPHITFWLCDHDTITAKWKSRAAVWLGGRGKALPPRSPHLEVPLPFQVSKACSHLISSPLIFL